MNKSEPTLQPILAHDIAPGEPLKVSDLDFYNLLRRQADESRLFFNQRRAVIFDVEAMGTLRQQMIESLGTELAMGVLTRFGYAHGYNDAEMLAKKFNWASDMDWLAAGPTLHMLEGIVHVEPQKIEFNRETGHFHMHGIWLNSYEAEQHLRCFNVSAQPVCWTLTGYASGYATRFLGREMLAIETECVGKGDARCYWEIRPVQQWGAEAEPYLKALKKIDVSNQLVETNHQLQEQIAENAHLFQQTEMALAEQKLLLAELETQRAMLQAVLQSIPAGVFVAEAPTGKPLLSNKYAEEILGKGISPEASVEELAEVYSAYRYGSDELYPANEMPLVRGMFGESTRVDDMEIHRPDGSQIALQVFGAPIYDASGRVTSSVAIVQDITETKRLYAETTQRATELEALSQISQRLSVVLDPKQLILEVVEQVGAAFNYYHTQIYLFDETRENMVLVGGTGEIGRLMLERHHSLPKGRGLVGRTAEQNKMVLVPDVRRNIGVEIITQANLEGVYQREADPAFEAKWYAQYIAQRFGDVKTLLNWFAVHPDRVKKALKLGYVLHVPGVFPEMIRRGAEAAARDLQVEVEVVTPAHDGQHLPLFEAMVRQGKDGLVVVPDQLSWVEPIQRTIETGLPVVTANRDLKFSPALMHVGQDNFQSGVVLARELIKLLSAVDKHEGKILISTGIADRNTGVRYGLRGTNYTLVEIEEFIEGDLSALKTYWEQALSRHPNLIAVVGLTEPEAPILAEIKRRTGEQWLIAGYDLNPATLEAVRDGIVQITIGQHPYLQGYLPILALVEHLRMGKSLEGWMAEGWLPNALLPETKAEAVVPIAVGERVLGVLDVQHNVAGGLKQENAPLLRSVADQVAIALENARLFEQTQATLAETESLYDAGRRISAASNLQEIVAAMAEEVPVPIVNRVVLHVFEYDSAGEMEAMTLLANWHNGVGTPPMPIGTRYPRATFTTTGLFLNPKPLFFDDIQQDERIEDSETLAVLQRQKIRAMAVLPLWLGTRQLGILLLQAEETHHFTEREIWPYLSLLGPVAVSIENKRLLEQTQTRARREQILREVTARVHASTDVDTIMRTAAQEVGRTLGRPAFIYLDPEEKQPNHEAEK